MTEGGSSKARPLFRSPRSVLAARSIAIVGASERSRWPAQIIESLRTHGYAGRVWLVNPRQSQVLGERCYPSLRDLPEPVEHAAIIVPSTAVAAVLEDADAAGLVSATVYAAGIGDGDDPASKERGRWLKAFLARSGLRVAGPNCMGAMSYCERLFAYPNGGLAALPAGPVGIVFQSGGTLQFFMQSGAARGLRYSYAISSGNEADLDLADYVSFLVDDPATTTIVLFIEGIRRPDAFMLAAGRALAAGKPIIAIKTGQSAGSRAAAASHTGAIAGDYAAFRAMCERYGIIVARSLDDMLEITLAFQCGRRPKGPRIGFVTTSGGTVDLLYDYAEAEGATLAAFSEATKTALLPLMQEGIQPKNPLDVGIPSTNEAAAEWCRIVLADGNVDMLGLAAQAPRKGRPANLEPLRTMRDATDKPVLGFGRMIYQVTPDVIDAQDKVGFAYLQGLEATLRAMNALWFHAARQGKAPLVPPPVKPSALTPATLDATLATYGITLPRAALAATPQAAARIAVEIGFPVALKIVSADILHKTEVGGVALDLRDRGEVEASAAQIIAKARAAHPAARIDGVLVQEMAGGVEAIIGARSDDLYGPMLLVGAGGVLVELAGVAALRMLPIEERDIADMIDGLKLSRLLAGYRGRPAADRPALERTAAALARFYLDHREVIADIEINPLMVCRDGEGAVAVDVRVIWR